MGGKGGSPGGGKFTPLRLAVALTTVAGFLGSMFGLGVLADTWMPAALLALTVPFFVVAPAIVIVGGWLIDKVEGVGA
jgi:ABC-type amino acid transport system permease subunit